MYVYIIICIATSMHMPFSVHKYLVRKRNPATVPCLFVCRLLYVCRIFVVCDPWCLGLRVRSYMPQVVLGASFGPLGGLLGPLGGSLGASWGPLGVPWEGSCALLGASWEIVKLR